MTMQTLCQSHCPPHVPGARIGACEPLSTNGRTYGLTEKHPPAARTAEVRNAHTRVRRIGRTAHEATTQRGLAAREALRRPA